MKTIIALLGLCITAAILSACGSKEVKPNDPVPVNCYDHQTLVDGKCVDKPQPTPPPLVCADGEVIENGQCVKPAPVCPAKAPGMFMCYDWAPCNGLFATYDSALAALNKYDAGGCSRIDGVVVKGGFGPCSECKSITGVQSMMAKSSAMTFEQVLEQRKKAKNYISK